uniref:GLIS family zinc finger 2 n=1 Tax=Chrysemys picta bellii TaxID=8478 RepID=A0A8C3IVF4_CHRPI
MHSLDEPLDLKISISKLRAAREKRTLGSTKHRGLHRELKSQDDDAAAMGPGSPGSPLAGLLLPSKYHDKRDARFSSTPLLDLSLSPPSGLDSPGGSTSLSPERQGSGDLPMVTNPHDFPSLRYIDGLPSSFQFFLPLGSGGALHLPASAFLTPAKEKRLSPELPLPQQLVCRWAKCNQLFDLLQDLVDHVNDFHVKPEKDAGYCCHWEGCARHGRGFNARYKMLIHIRTHTNEKPHRCPTCNKSFSRLENLKIHNRSHTGQCQGWRAWVSPPCTKVSVRAAYGPAAVALWHAGSGSPWPGGRGPMAHQVRQPMAWWRRSHGTLGQAAHGLVAEIPWHAGSGSPWPGGRSPMAHQVRQPMASWRRSHGTLGQAAHDLVAEDPWHAGSGSPWHTGSGSPWPGGRGPMARRVRQPMAWWQRSHCTPGQAAHGLAAEVLWHAGLGSPWPGGRGPMACRVEKPVAAHGCCVPMQARNPTCAPTRAAASATPTPATASSTRAPTTWTSPTTARCPAATSATRTPAHCGSTSRPMATLCPTSSRSCSNSSSLPRPPSPRRKCLTSTGRNSSSPTRPPSLAGTRCPAWAPLCPSPWPRVPWTSAPWPVVPWALLRCRGCPAPCCPSMGRHSTWPRAPCWHLPLGLAGWGCQWCPCLLARRTWRSARRATPGWPKRAKLRGSRAAKTRVTGLSGPGSGVLRRACRCCPAQCWTCPPA